MSSAVHKRVRERFTKMAKPLTIDDVYPPAKAAARMVRIALDRNVRITGSYADGLPWVDSDLDLVVNSMPMASEKEKVRLIGVEFGLKIDLGTNNGEGLPVTLKGEE